MLHYRFGVSRFIYSKLSRQSARPTNAETICPLMNCCNPVAMQAPARKAWSFIRPPFSAISPVSHHST